jgi:hypothetical protein
MNVIFPPFGRAGVFARRAAFAFLATGADHARSRTTLLFVTTGWPAFS